MRHPRLSRYLSPLVIALALIAPGDAGASTPRAPLYSTASPTSSPVELGGSVYFVARLDGGVGALVRTDGTHTGTSVVTTPDPLGSDARSIIAFGDHVYFTIGAQLWQSDGTPTGSKPAVAGLTPALTQLGSTDSGVHAVSGRDRLVRLDPAQRSLSTVAAWPGLDLTLIGALPNGTLFVWVNEGGNLNDGPFHRTLMSVDTSGTATELARSVTPQDNPAVIAGGALYYVRDDGEHGAEPWVSDGTASGTRLVADLTAGGGSLGAEFAAAGDTAYIATGDTTAKAHLFRLSPTSASPIRAETTRQPFASRLVATASAVYLFAGSSASQPVWRASAESDVLQPTPMVGSYLASAAGTAAGLLFQTSPETRLWFAPEGAAAREIARPTLPVGADAVLSSELPPKTIGGLTYFAAHDDTLRLWRSDGTAAGTWPIVPAVHRSELTLYGSEPEISPGPYGFRGTIAFAGDAATRCRGRVALTIRSRGRAVTTIRPRVQWTRFLCRWSAMAPEATFKRGGPFTARVTFGHGRKPPSSRSIGLRL